MSTTPQTTADKKQQLPVHKFSSLQVTPIYSEGLSQLMVGYPNSRFMLDSRPGIVSADGKEVTHYVAAEVIMPTNALADLALKIVDGLLQSKEQLGSLGTEWTADLVAKVEQLKQQTSGDTK